ncbi:MAG: transposase [Terriglobales bacterium]
MTGFDEHFFTRRQGYATTICDLRNRRIYDVRLRRSEIALEPWLRRLEGKEQVRLVCMDLAGAYRSLVRKHYTNTRILADRFRVIRLSVGSSPKDPTKSRPSPAVPSTARNRWSARPRAT